MTTPTVAVAGGGLAGLVTARRLATAGVDVTLFEREETVGGRVRSARDGSYVYDRGFQVLFTAYPAARRELEYGPLDLRRFKPGACIARPGERSILSDPLRDVGALTDSLFNREVSTGDKLRTLKLRRDLKDRQPNEMFVGPDKTIREYLLERGFSRRFVGNFAAPFYGGITLDRDLSTSKRVFEYTFRTLSSGAIAVPARGMGAITEQLRDRARDTGATIETGATVEEVAAGDADATLDLGDETLTADAVVVATDARSAGSLTDVDGLPTEANACVTQWYDYPGSKPLDAGARLHLNATSDAPNHVVEHTAVAPEYAPDGRALLSATFLGEREESDGALATRTRETLASWYPEQRFDDLELRRTDRIPFAQFAQPPGIHEGLPDVRDPEGPVYLAGEYTEWSSIQGAMESGRLAARAVREDLDVGL
jgi:phytoene dehydrogenase-like protein